MRTVIFKLFNVWVLSVESDEQVYFAYTARTLIQAIGMASDLQLHITNIDQLPLNQYNQGAKL